jgi:hypothetical protein
VAEDEEPDVAHEPGTSIRRARTNCAESAVSHPAGRDAWQVR